MTDTIGRPSAGRVLYVHDGRAYWIPEESLASVKRAASDAYD